jgi:hypothetical protein
MCLMIRETILRYKLFSFSSIFLLLTYINKQSKKKKKKKKVVRKSTFTLLLIKKEKSMISSCKCISVTDLGSNPIGIKYFLCRTYTQEHIK